MQERKDTASSDEIASHMKRLRRLAVALVRDATEADDVLQETLVAALRAPPHRGPTVSAWLSQVMRNVVHKRWLSGRRRSARERRATTLRLQRPPEQQLEYRERSQALLDAMKSLTPEKRQIVCMRFFDALPPRKISDELGIPIETVKSRLRRALVDLRQKLHAVGGREWPIGLSQSFGIDSSVVRTVGKGRYATSLGLPFAGGVVLGLLVLVSTTLYLLLPESNKTNNQGQGLHARALDKNTRKNRNPPLLRGRVTAKNHLASGIRGKGDRKTNAPTGATDGSAPESGPDMLPDTPLPVSVQPEPVPQRPTNEEAGQEFTTGRVVDAETGRPVRSFRVNNVMVNDANGRFRDPWTAGENRLWIDARGYVTLRHLVDSRHNLVLGLTPNSNVGFVKLRAVDENGRRIRNWSVTADLILPWIQESSREDGFVLLAQGSTKKEMQVCYAPGHAVVHLHLNFEPGSTREQTVVLARGAPIELTMLGNRGRPVEGVKLEVLSSAGSRVGWRFQSKKWEIEQECLPDQSKNLLWSAGKLKGLAAGTYTIIASKEQHRVERSVEIHPTKATSLKFPLGPMMFLGR